MADVADPTGWVVVDGPVERSAVRQVPGPLVPSAHPATVWVCHAADPEQRDAVLAEGVPPDGGGGVCFGQGGCADLLARAPVAEPPWRDALWRWASACPGPEADRAFGPDGGAPPSHRAMRLELGDDPIQVHGDDGMVAGVVALARADTSPWVMGRGGQRLARHDDGTLWSALRRAAEGLRDRPRALLGFALGGFPGREATRAYRAACQHPAFVDHRACAPGARASTVEDLTTGRATVFGPAHFAREVWRVVGEDPEARSAAIAPLVDCMAPELPPPAEDPGSLTGWNRISLSCGRALASLHPEALPEALPRVPAMDNAWTRLDATGLRHPVPERVHEALIQTGLLPPEAPLAPVEPGAPPVTHLVWHGAARRLPPGDEARDDIAAFAMELLALADLSPHRVSVGEPPSPDARWRPLEVEVDGTRWRGRIAQGVDADAPGIAAVVNGLLHELCTEERLLVVGGWFPYGVRGTPEALQRAIDAGLLPPPLPDAAVRRAQARDRPERGLLRASPSEQADLLEVPLDTGSAF